VEESLDADTEDRLRQLHEKVSRQSPAPQSPLEDLLEKERLDRLRAAILEMPPQMRRCFFLRYLRGYKYREIAYLMKISIQTVRAHLHQARSRLTLDLPDLIEEAEE
jgi:RNA polymerase sigma-70 factor (ECF subfamily)